jgi:hypothetical protein
MFKLISSQIVALKDGASNVAWSPLVQTARSLCLGILGQTAVGKLEISDCDGQFHVFGENKVGQGPHVQLTVHKDTFWVRLALFADMVRLDERHQLRYIFFLTDMFERDSQKAIFSQKSPVLIW